MEDDFLKRGCKIHFKYDKYCWQY